MIVLTLTLAEAHAMSYAVGNSIADGEDESLFGGRKRAIAAVWRAADKLNAGIKQAHAVRGVRARRVRRI